MRNIFAWSAFVGTIGVYILHYFLPGWWLLSVFILVLIAFGVYDMIQTKHAIRRNFPLIGRMRYLLESIGPEIRQYFIESDTSGTPFTRLQRAVVYRRAKMELQSHPFGTELNVYEENYEWMPHSIYPAKVQHDQFRVNVGGPDCTQPYNASIFNVSAMSYGALSKNAVLAINRGAYMGSFYHNTGEGGVSPYHIEGKGDIVWQIGTGYFGCRTEEGTFDADKFKKQATNHHVKMIEIKLSQGAKPGHGGVLPASKNTEEIAAIRGVVPHTTVLSPPSHSAFSNALSLLEFVQKLRNLSGGKPVGFKLCIGNKHEFIDICEQMISSGIKPDFITIDGAEGGTGSAPLEFSNSVGMPLEDALVFVINTLRGYDLKKDIRVISSGKIVTSFDIVKQLAIGADMCNSARSMLFAIGCIQALKCDTNECPTGITTHKKQLVQGLVVKDKAQRIANFHRETMHSFNELVAAAGITDIKKLNRNIIFQRVDSYTSKSFEEIYPSTPIGSLLK
jgi:glutamate synthase domain-containing protein 2